jgi:drug/metabolite transporter superfamily protein YnfA
MRLVTILIGSAVLEAGGNALVREGLQQRWWWILFGVAALGSYGLLVNQGRLDFGRLMGCYIAAFFVVSQVLSVVMFHQMPSARTLIGGGLIVAGGFTIMG